MDITRGPYTYVIIYLTCLRVALFNFLHENREQSREDSIEG